jgi:hypothetical protein
VTPPGTDASAAPPAAEARRHCRREARVLANFYPELTLSDEGRTVEVAGPLNWDQIPPHIQAVTVLAVVAQNGVEGRCTSREYRRRDGEREWWSEVRVERDRAFVPGTAPCAGAIHATDPRGAPPWLWSGDPELIDP